MLYVTTRNNRDVFTAQHTLAESRGPDGGMFLPFHPPELSEEQVNQLLELPTNACIASIWNLLFPGEVTAWDLDFSAGRSPVRLKQLQHRTMVGEAWHNPGWNFLSLVQCLAGKGSSTPCVPTLWAKIGVRIGVLFAIFGQLRRCGIESADISVVSGDFSAPISAWYARKWGLPIGNILCCCNENNSLWDLICHGQLRTDAVSVSTRIPEADVAVPEALEHLLYQCAGPEEVQRYLDICRRGEVYTPAEPVWRAMKQDLYVSVISTHRVGNLISNVYNSQHYLLEPAAALAYGGLLDYRSKTGQTRAGVILSEVSPAKSRDALSRLLDVPEKELESWT